MAERKRDDELIHVNSDEQLLRVVRDVVRSTEAASVDVENVGQVTISPLAPAPLKPRKKMTHEEREAKRDRDLRGSFGSWKDVDIDEPRSIATPANGMAFTAEEIAERQAVIDSLFGIWSDIDGDAWKKRIKAERGSNRPLVDFDR
jgi:hypothetical protein